MLSAGGKIDEIFYMIFYDALFAVVVVVVVVSQCNQHKVNKVFKGNENALQILTKNYKKTEKKNQKKQLKL